MLMQTRAFVFCEGTYTTVTGGYTTLEQKIINFKHMSVARIARSVDSCWTFSQRGQECTQPHSNSADTRRVCAPVCKCGTYTGICAWEVLCSQAPSGLTTGFKPCQPVPTLYAHSKKMASGWGKIRNISASEKTQVSTSRNGTCGCASSSIFNDLDQS